MRLTDLLFLASVVLSVSLFALIVMRIFQKQNARAQNTARWLLGFLCLYGSVLVVTATFMPRRYFAPGERHCFDDWCVAAVNAQPADKSGQWNVTLEIVSEARRVRQRARDAFAEVEDSSGRRYAACSEAKTATKLTDVLDPGESVRVHLPFCLPEGTQVAGVVVHHGAFPGALIIGDDQSLWHHPALLRVR